MAVSSTSTSTSRTGSTLDVAGIVSGLMQAENVPVTKLDAKISKSTVKITSLGQIKSQLSSTKSKKDWTQKFFKVSENLASNAAVAKRLANVSVSASGFSNSTIGKIQSLRQAVSVCVGKRLQEYRACL